MIQIPRVHGKESESESEKDGCLTLLMDMLPTLDKELALTLSCKLTEYFNFLFVDLDNIDQSVVGVEKVTLLQLVDSIFRLETEKVKKDILSCSQTYKSLNVHRLRYLKKCLYFRLLI